ncbi:uncharacterized protein LOC100893943 [Strongylocentrotus purpuratus]|uniref:TIR domain-containing protein n=1 Tax=Strongylocentrotus purpuratus TaxID=7668 RepID=A0A7M7GFC7_STRPU|nr:uncharacterized protein LOC100893943 [Strongylocentrotus purpuratus]
MGNFIILGFSALRNTMPFAWMQRLRDRIRPRSEGSASSTTPDLMEGVPENLQEQFNVIFNAVNHVESCANIPCGTCLSGVALVKEISGNSALDQERIGDLMAERTSFSRMLTSCWQKKELLEMFTDASATDTLLKEAQRSFEFYRALAGICWNYTDESNPFCLSIEEEGRLSIIVDWMLSLQDNTLNKWATEIVFNVLNILHNTCRRVEDIRRSHRQIVPALEKLTASEDPIVQACAFMSLSYMVDKEEADKLTTNSACVDNLLSLLRQSLENVEHKIRITRSTGTDAFRRGFTLSAIELVQGIEQLAINDENKRLIAENDGIAILSRMLEMDCTSQEKRHAAEALWQLAFRQENKDRLREEHDLLKELVSLSCGPDPALNQACKGALFEIYSSKLPDELTTANTSTASQTPSTPTEKPSQHIMISYRWEQPSKSVMSEIKDQLRSRGYNVWMDEDFMSGDIIEKMAKAVENSYLILACVTEGYQESKNCRTEATYAYDCNKRIVPVKVNERFKASGWLGGITAGKIYYPVPDVDQVTDQLPRIIDLEIEEELQKNPEAQSGARSGGSAEPEVRTWEVNKVREWLTSNGISSTNESLQNLTGLQLLQLKKQLATAPDTFYQSMKEDLKVPYMEVLSLAAALENL